MIRYNMPTVLRDGRRTLKHWLRRLMCFAHGHLWGPWSFILHKDRGLFGITPPVGPLKAAFRQTCHRCGLQQEVHE